MKINAASLFRLFSYFSFIIYLGVFVFFISYLFIRSDAPFSSASVFGESSFIKAVFYNEPVFEGLYPALCGTLLLVAISVLIAVPFGTGTGLWLSEFAKGRKQKVMTLLIDILSGLPSIVIGLFGFSIILIMHKIIPAKSPGFSIIVSSFSLSVLVLPYIAKSTQTAVASLDKSLKLSGLSLGADKIENIRYILLPKAFPSILSGILLAIARCAEDTAVIMLTGAVANAGIPGSIFERFEALPFFIYYTSSEYTSENELEMAFNASVLLIFICIVLFIISYCINSIAFKRKKRAK